MEYQQFGKYLSMLYRNFQIYINKELEDIGISGSEYPFLFNLEDKEVNQAYFTKLLSIDPAITTRVLKSLENKGCIERRKDPKDKRNTLIKITEKGEKLKPIILKKIQKWEDKIYAGLKNSDIILMQKMVKTVAMEAVKINRGAELDE